MDEACMIEWLRLVIQPWANSAPVGIVPVLYLDPYQCHLMDSVVSKIQVLGVEVKHIPGGCTGLGQPLDVGYNKPLKNKIRQKWEEYMIDEGLDLDVTKPPTRNLVAKWCINSMKEIPNSIVMNCWLLTGYSYFPNEKSMQLLQWKLRPTEK